MTRNQVKTSWLLLGGAAVVGALYFYRKKKLRECWAREHVKHTLQAQQQGLSYGLASRQAAAAASQICGGDPDKPFKYF